VGADTNGLSDVFRRDLKTGQTVRVSIRSNGSQTADDGFGFGASTDASISADGNVVAFESTDDQLTADPDYDNKGDSDVFVRNLSQGTTVRASLKADGSEADPLGNQSNSLPVISGNGRFVAFTADIYGKFVAEDSNNAFDVYLKDLQNGAVGRLSVRSDGQEVPFASGQDAPAAISANGRYVAFESYGPLVASDTNPSRDVYLRDRVKTTTRRVSITTRGKQVTGSNHQLPAISADGHWVAFSSLGKFSAGDSGTDFDVFERGPLR